MLTLADSTILEGTDKLNEEDDQLENALVSEKEKIDWTKKQKQLIARGGYNAIDEYEGTGQGRNLLAQYDEDNVQFKRKVCCASCVRFLNLN